MANSERRYLDGVFRTAFKPLAVHMLGRAGYELRCTRFIPPTMLDSKHRRELMFRDVVCRLMYDLDRTRLTFVQVGAFDGVSCDPLHDFVIRHGWRGVLLEPQPTVFERLVHNYEGHSDLILKNAAIGEHARELTLYTVDARGLPAWCGGLASFSRASIERHAAQVPDLAKRIIPIQVPTVSFHSVLDELREELVDILQIDTEGFDADVLRMFPFERTRPTIIHFERKHLTANQLEACLRHLSRFGYRFAFDGEEDMTAVLHESATIQNR